MKRIFFHIGLPKTGTTSIQRQMRIHHDALRELGILYPLGPNTDAIAEHSSRDGQGPHADMATRFFDIKANLLASGINWETIFDEFRNDTTLHSLVISHETQSVASNKLKRDAYLSAINGSEASFLVYLREPVSWLNSLYIQNMTSVHPFSGKPENFPNLKRYLESGFEGILSPFDELGELVIKSYENARAEDNLLEGFFHYIGAKDSPRLFENSTRANAKSMSRDQIRFLNGVKQSNPEPEILRIIQNTLIDQNEKTANISRNATVINRDLAQKIRNRWDRDRLVLERKFGYVCDDPKPIDDSAGFEALTQESAEELRKQIGPHLPPEARPTMHKGLRIAQRT